ncbi:MAG: RNA 2',3'-cyclic phosphodiesterase [Gemmatimonadota bacterium]
MRLFAAIPIPEPALGELASVLERLRSMDWPVRWVRPEGLHLTLKFFGQVPGDETDLLENALARAAEGHGPVPVACTGLGSFPPGRRARVIWMGLDAPAGLELLQDSVERSCESAGYAVEGRPFRPHVTLGRVLEGKNLPINALEHVSPINEIAFLAEKIVLFESRPASGGPSYIPLRSIGLTSCQAV